MDHDNLPYGWMFTTLGNYLCMCGFIAKHVLEIENHIEYNVDGDFYKCGLRGISRTETECICGIKFANDNINKLWQMERDHFDNQTNGKIPICMKSAKQHCDKCDINFIGVGDLKRHYDTRKHQEFGQEIDLNCSICDIKCRGQLEMRTHLDTKKHKQIVANGKIELECKSCNIKCPSQKQKLTHLETKKHKKLLIIH